MAPKLGEILIGAKVIDQHQLESALSAQQKWGGKLGEILVNRGICSEEMLVKSLSRQLNIARAEIDNLNAVPADALAKISHELSVRLDAVPMELRPGGKVLVAAMSDPMNTQALTSLEEASGCKIQALLAGPRALARFRARVYGTDAMGAPAKNPKEGHGHKGDAVVLSASGEKASRETIALRQPAAPRPISPGLSPSEAAAHPHFAPSPEQQHAAANAHSHSEHPANAQLAAAMDAASGPALLRALIDTLIARGIFSQEEFLKHLRDHNFGQKYRN